MRTITCIVAPFTLAALACNTPTTGEQGELSFTPTRCGNPLLNCSFAAGLATGGAIDVQITSVGGASLDGVTVESSNHVTVEDIADADGVPTWSVTAQTAGGAELRVRDAQGGLLDSLTFSVYAPERLGLLKLVGTATGPATEAGADEAWTVPAGQLVSFQVIPIAGAYRMMGRLSYTISGSAAVLDTEQSTSDRASGYLYVQPPAGDHLLLFSRDVVDGLDLAVSLHAE